jgi:hypothetical protein
VIGRRLRALLIATVAVAGLIWCISRLEALGAPFLPAFLAGIVPPAVHAAISQIGVQLGALAIQLGTLLVTILQIAVAALALVAVLALLVALRRPRPPRQGTVETYQAPRTAASVNAPVVLPQHCPNCGRPVHADWVACPTCTISLPVASRGLKPSA